MKKAFSKKNLWDKTPAFMKAAFGMGFGLMPLDWLLGAKFRAKHKFIQKSQWWSVDQFRQYQMDRLSEILRLAYEKTKYYHRMFDSVGFNPNDFKSLDDLIHLPIINKQTIIDNLSDMCTKSISDSDVDYVSTGGTSGVPLHFYINAGRSAIEYAYLTTSWQRAGYKLGMPMAVLRGRIVKPDKNGFYHEYDPILRHHYYSNFHTNSDNLRSYLEHISGIGDCVFHAYPSSAQTLAKFIIGNGKQAPKNIKSVILESENVFSDQVEDIEKAFGVKCFSSYGHSEKLVLAAQCEQSKNYHVWPTYGYFELLDEKGHAVTTPGQSGEIVGTGFINTVMPFIRYRTGDYATYVSDHCDVCKRQNTVITDIKGRWPQGELIAYDGSIVSMTALNVHDDTFKNIKEYQFHQFVHGKATLCIIPIVPLDEAEQQRIVKNINKRLQGQVEINLELRTELVKTAIGKQPRVIQKCNIVDKH